MIHSYPKVWNIGHPQLDGLFDGPVVVEEKLDGSQFSMAVFDGQLHCRSKGRQIVLDAPDRLFQAAVTEAQDRADAGLLHEGWVYRCEYLSKPKHNTLAYDRLPAGHLVLFDVETEPNRFLPPGARHEAAVALGIEPVPVLSHAQIVEDADSLRALLDRESVLGGCEIEGIVVKNHRQFGRDGKILAGKHVSERFREVHGKEWRKTNPTGGDIVTQLVDRYRAEGRWAKAVHHLSDAGLLEGSPRDIGILIKTVRQDLVEECADEAKEILWKWAVGRVLRGSVGGLAEWYKQRLLDAAFDGQEPQ